jgi:hypothetical protein
MKVRTKELRLPHETASDEACLRALEQADLLTAGTRKHLSAFEPVTPKGGKRLSDLVIEDRGSPPSSS